jgi:hypothetical protein
MSEYVSYINSAPIEVNRSDQPVRVTGNIEHDLVADFVCGWKSGTQVLKAAKVGVLH